MFSFTLNFHVYPQIRIVPNFNSFFINFSIKLCLFQSQLNDQHKITSIVANMWPNKQRLIYFALIGAQFLNLILIVGLYTYGYYQLEVKRIYRPQKPHF